MKQKLGIFLVLVGGMMALAYPFGAEWNCSIASYFGLRKMTYTEALGVLQAVSSAVMIGVFTVKLFRDEDE
jgi:hypothetical protein